MKQTVFRIFTVGGTAPTPTLVGITQVINTTVTLPNNTSTQLLAANANRRYASIKNVSGSTIHLNFAAAAALTSMYPLPTGESFDIGPDTAFGLYLGEVRGIQVSGGAEDISVLEMQ